MNVSDYFYDENGAVIRNAEEVECPNLRFSEYECREIDGKKYIIGLGGLAKPSQLTIKKTDLLFSLLNLANKLTRSPHGFGHLEDSITDLDVNLMIKFCEKYGLPFVGELGVKTFDNNSLIMKYKLRGFRINSFEFYISYLHDAFLHWERIYSPNTLNENDNRFYNESIVQAKRMLQSSLKAANISVNIDFSGNEPVFRLQGQDLIDAAFIHLAFLISSPDGSHLKRCKICNNLFIAKGRSEYCKNCSRQSAYKAKRKCDPIKRAFDKKYHSMYQKKYHGTISEQNFTDWFLQAKKYKNNIEHLIGDEKETAVLKFLNWLNEKDGVQNGNNSKAW